MSAIEIRPNQPDIVNALRAARETVARVEHETLDSMEATLHHLLVSRTSGPEAIDKTRREIRQQIGWWDELPRSTNDGIAQRAAWAIQIAAYGYQKDERLFPTALDHEEADRARRGSTLPPWREALTAPDEEHSSELPADLVRRATEIADMRNDAARYGVEVVPCRENLPPWELW